MRYSVSVAAPKKLNLIPADCGPNLPPGPASRGLLSKWPHELATSSDCAATNGIRLSFQDFSTPASVDWPKPRPAERNNAAMRKRFITSSYRQRREFLTSQETASATS